MIPSAFITSSQSTKLSAALPCGKATCVPLSNSPSGMPRLSAAALIPHSCATLSTLIIGFPGESPYLRFLYPFSCKSAPTALKTAGCVVQAFSASVFASRFGFRMIRLSCTSGFSPAESTRSRPPRSSTARCTAICTSCPSYVPHFTIATRPLPGNAAGFAA